MDRHVRLSVIITSRKFTCISRGVYPLDPYLFTPDSHHHETPPKKLNEREPDLGKAFSPKFHSYHLTLFIPKTGTLGLTIGLYLSIGTR